MILLKSGDTLILLPIKSEFDKSFALSFLEEFFFFLEVFLLLLECKTGSWCISSSTSTGNELRRSLFNISLSTVCSMDILRPWADDKCFGGWTLIFGSARRIETLCLRG